MENEIVCKEISKTYCKVCKICKQKMKQTPIRKIGHLILLEHYCPDCETSEITYEDVDKL